MEVYLVGEGLKEASIIDTKKELLSSSFLVSGCKFYVLSSM